MSVAVVRAQGVAAVDTANQYDIVYSILNTPAGSTLLRSIRNAMYLVFRESLRPELGEATSTVRRRDL